MPYEVNLCVGKDRSVRKDVFVKLRVCQSLETKDGVG